MNFIFISPNYPDFFYKFCAALKNRGECVLGVGDSAEVRSELCGSLTEYFVLPDMKNFSVFCNLVTTICAKYGSIFGVDSINEFWLETESMLREKFSIAGAKGELMLDYKYKSRMKARFEKANVKACAWAKTQNRTEILDFATRQGYPLFCKPDNGVGANGVHKIDDYLQLVNFLDNNNFGEYIFEPYIDGELYSFDGLCDKDGDFVFVAAHRFYTPIDKLKENGGECVYTTLTDIPPELFCEGTKAVKAFELKNSFFHIEFFKLNKPLNDISADSFVALEANMRIAGGYTAEMLYHALGLDIYSLWAAVVCGEKPNIQNYLFSNIKRTVVNVARKNKTSYKYTTQELQSLFPQEFILSAETAKDDNPFGNLEIIAAFTNNDRQKEFIDKSIEKA